MPIRGWTLNTLTVRQELRDRLRLYQQEIRSGRCISLRDAVRAETVAARNQHDAEHLEARWRWANRQDAKARQRERILRYLILDGRPCAYCSCIATDLDHIIPTSRGGTWTLRNLAAACRSCNSEKGNRTPEEWKAWRLARGRTWPPVRAAA